MVLLEFSIFPLDKGESVSAYVARCLDIVDRSGVNYRSHAMGTVLEGGYDEVMAVVQTVFRGFGGRLQPDRVFHETRLPEGPDKQPRRENRQRRAKTREKVAHIGKMGRERL